MSDVVLGGGEYCEIKRIYYGVLQYEYKHYCCEHAISVYFEGNYISTINITQKTRIPKISGTYTATFVANKTHGNINIENSLQKSCVYPLRILCLH